MSAPYEKMLLLCPVAVTGGPEAIHQLAQIANEHGVPAEIVYYGVDAYVAMGQGRLEYRAPSQNRCLEAYAKYNPVVARSTELTPSTLAVLPEVRAGLYDKFVPAQVAVWWLSVDNAFHAQSPLNDQAYRAKFFADGSVIHLCQTARSRDTIRRLGAAKLHRLVDYTDEQFTLHRPSVPNAGAALAYNQRKGAKLAESFFSTNPGFEKRPIAGMNKRQIYDIFRDTMIFVEFGHNPGNDRMPREAACAGCIVLAHRKGGSASYEDMPIPDLFKFDAEDVASGKLAELVAQLQADPRPYWEQQAVYRSYLYTEKELMILQTRRMLGV